MNEGRKKHLLIGFAGLLVGFGIGYFVGFATAIKALVEMASYFIDIDYDTVLKAVTQYDLNIKDCYG